MLDTSATTLTNLSNISSMVYNPATWMLEISSSAIEAQLNIDFAEIYANSWLYGRNQGLIKQLITPSSGSEDIYFSTQEQQLRQGLGNNFKISFQEFKNKLLEPGLVDHIVVSNKSVAKRNISNIAMMMEKSPAAYAEDWSIQLEKSLRSKAPVEALEEIGIRLQRWNSQPELSFAEYRMFGLISGEDKLFLNAIFLRLGDAFRSGNKHIKRSLVKLFLKMKSRERGEEGILSKGKLENYLELVRRVKEVFDKGDAEERTFALLLLGCWAHFTKDCPDIRCDVLSSLVTGGVCEVKAALFAAGCLSELCDDFASVFLEILATMIQSQDISEDVKLACGRAFAKLWCPFSLAQKAYKTGLKVLMDSSENRFSALMLTSLSKIASRWMLLVPSQVELLFLFLSEERSLHIQATSLRCCRIILKNGVCSVPSTTGTISKLFGILHRSNLEPTIQLEALRVLHKILLFDLSIIACTEIPEIFLELLAIIKTTLHSSCTLTRVVAVRVLADLSGIVLGRVDMVSCGAGYALASQMTSFVLDHIFCLMTPKASSFYQDDIVVEFEVKILLSPLFNLVENHPYLHSLVLNNLCLFTDKFMKMLDAVKDLDLKMLSESNIMLHVSKIIVACLQNLENTDDTETSQILEAVKLQSQNICHRSYFGSHTSMSYFLLLHLLSTFISMRHVAQEVVSLSRNSALSYADSIFQSDKLAFECAKIKMLDGNTYWYLYKAGITAACQGAWFTSSFIFEELIMAVQSASCSCWLKFLAQYSMAEKQIQLYILADQGNSVSFRQNLLAASNTLLSSKQILSTSDMDDMFSFQTWFLTLRANTLKTVVDMLKLLDTLHLYTATSHDLGSLCHSSIEVSRRMYILAQEFDLLLASFMVMDRQSVMSVSALAFSCSLMAFVAGFAFLVPNMHSSENNRISEFSNSADPHLALLIEDLIARVTHANCKTRESLLFLQKSFRNCKGCFSGWSQNKITCTSYEAIVLHKLAEYSIREIIGLGNEAQQDSEGLSRILTNGTQLLLQIFSRLMLIPVRTPRHFFRIRPAVSSEVLMMNEDGQTIDGSSILSGVPLSLNLSFQLKNKPVGPPGPLNKAYCILSFTAPSQKTNRQAQPSRQDQAINDVMDLNEKLSRYVAGSVCTHGALTKSNGTVAA
ncbi:ARM repeat superfamily protein [Striga hermonthica]|uniref:ARM repeat superfamily protein n=1 Tax=Striga hermonthica TaxID=68872 RepID=A0A9N7N8B0_STRHE|nr:ARM repeat superfamily protein [Striga hermonthica]